MLAAASRPRRSSSTVPCTTGAAAPRRCQSELQARLAPASDVIREASGLASDSKAVQASFRAGSSNLGCGAGTAQSAGALARDFRPVAAAAVRPMCAECGSPCVAETGSGGRGKNA